MRLPLPAPASTGPRRALTVLATLALLGGSVAGPTGPAGAAGVDRSAPPGAADHTTVRLDNPYVGAQVYVNPEWSARASAEPGGAAVADQPTAVWLDRISDIAGTDGGMGLREHLDTALAQDADLIQVTLYNLPGRDCNRRVSEGELAVNELARYRAEFVDPIVGILADPAYAGLRIVTIVEPNSLPNLVTHISPRPAATAGCDLAYHTGSYVLGIGYALARLGTLPNVYAYLDASHHGQLGAGTDGTTAARLFYTAATAGGASAAYVHGFSVNTANYSVLAEPYFDVEDVVNGQPVRETGWVGGSYFIDELPYAQRLRTALVATGFSPAIGMLVDTSRNGWGGVDRPTGPGPLTTAEEYVEAGRTDRRGWIGNWCNQTGAGLGARPTATPLPRVDAYVWIKPPGESDGSADPLGMQRPYEPMCDPTYRPHLFPTVYSGALMNAPPLGEWFPAHFRQLVSNAWPPL